MAEVYLARREGIAGFKKYVAIKRMRSDLTSHQEFVDLFAEEAKTASLLNHPNICQVFEFNASDNQYYMVLELLEGVPVSSVMIKALRRQGWPTLAVAIAMVVQACDGVHYAHTSTDDEGTPLDIVHRDISPPNLFLTSSGTVKLLDFGISKSKQSVVQTMTGQIRGKFSYMSPEQLQSKKLDCRSDIFSLGIVLHELVTGKRLFRRSNRLQVYHAITSEPIPLASEVRAELPPELEAVIMRALARDRNERFETAQDMGDALRRVSSTFGGLAENAELAEFLANNFAAELASKRDLFTSPLMAAGIDSEETGLSASGSASGSNPGATPEAILGAARGVVTNPTVSLRKPIERKATQTEADATVPGHIPTDANTVTVDFESENVSTALPASAESDDATSDAASRAGHARGSDSSAPVPGGPSAADSMPRGLRADTAADDELDAALTEPSGNHSIGIGTAPGASASGSNDGPPTVKIDAVSGPDEV